MDSYEAILQTIHKFVGGAILTMAIIIFFWGALYRFISMVTIATDKDMVVIEYMKFRLACRSILHWIIPFRSVNMKKQPVMTVITFTFHICLIILPFFSYAHIALLKEKWNIGWAYLSDTSADIMTIIVIACCVYFLIRRLTQPEVKYLSSPSDFAVLAMVAAPFITGFWTQHQWYGYKIMGIIHMLSGEILLAAIPFTWLRHMIFFPFTRGYIGSEFGAKNVKDW